MRHTLNNKEQYVITKVLFEYTIFPEHEDKEIICYLISSLTKIDKNSIEVIVKMYDILDLILNEIESRAKEKRYYKVCDNINELRSLLK